MPNFEICYVDGGSLVGIIATECASSKQAAILAHALKFRDRVQVEIWQGETLTYVRPAMLPAALQRPHDPFITLREQPRLRSA